MAAGAPRTKSGGLAARSGTARRGRGGAAKNQQRQRKPGRLAKPLI